MVTALTGMGSAAHYLGMSLFKSVAFARGVTALLVLIMAAFVGATWDKGGPTESVIMRVRNDTTLLWGEAPWIVETSQLHALSLIDLHRKPSVSVLVQMYLPLVPCHQRHPRLHWFSSPPAS